MPFAEDIPPIECLLRREYLYNLEPQENKYEPCLVHAVDSIEGQALGFDILLQNGAMFSRLPISAFCWKECEALPLSQLELWNNFSYSLEVHEYGILRDCRVMVRNLGAGNYLFSINHFRSAGADLPGSFGFKRFHIIRLDSGHFCAMPNNYCRFENRSWVTTPFNDNSRPDYKVNTHIWNAERGASEDSEKYFYDAKIDIPNSGKSFTWVWCGNRKLSNVVPTQEVYKSVGDG